MQAYWIPFFYKIKEQIEDFVIFDIWTVMIINTTVFWNMTPCSLVERFQTGQCHNPETFNILWFVRRSVTLQVEQ
jgi:hypothetical protein